jgi:hypothetical protein
MLTDFILRLSQLRGSSELFTKRGDIPMSSQVETVRQIARQFCLEFVKAPYLCYTEHGLHALFYTMLYNALPADQRHTTWYDHQVCVLQKEYPTAGRLGKTRRQNWDIAVIRTPPHSTSDDVTSSYDFLHLAAVVEVGMNEPEDHLRDDIERLSRPEANVDQRFIVHLYRLSEPGAKLSGRDWSANSRRIVSEERAAEIAAGKPVEVYYGLYDSTGKHKSGVWLIKGG